MCISFRIWCFFFVYCTFLFDLWLNLHIHINYIDRHDEQRTLENSFLLENSDIPIKCNDEVAMHVLLGAYLFSTHPIVRSLHCKKIYCFYL